MSKVIYPSPIAYEEIDFSWMVGRFITDIAFLEPDLWRFHFGQSARIAVECLWRIVDHRHIVLTSADHRQQFGLPASIDASVQATSLLSSRSVKAVQLRDATADILIDFHDDRRLEIFPTSSGYESWQVFAPGGICFVAQGGGQICAWTQ